MRHRLGWFAFFALSVALGLSGCATSSRPTGATPSSMADLRLCPGMAVSNAPTSDQTGKIAGYSNIAVVRGILLARAPVDACLSSGFGPRKGGAGSFHDGADLYTGIPRRVLAAGDGDIAWVRELRGYGLTIEIDHGNAVSTRYAHLSAAESALRAGIAVRAGETIGHTGRTGNATATHLHYEIRIDGRAEDPLRIGD